MILRTLRRLLLAWWVPALAAGPRGAGAQETLSWGEMQREMSAREIRAPEARIAWGAGAEQFGELRLPPGEGPFPVAVVLHGGCWQSIAGLDYMDAFAEALNRAGWATWSVEFRRIDQPGGAWPGILEDVAAAADHLWTLAESHPLALDQVVAAGHSSGGHLALWLSVRGKLPDDRPGGPRLRGNAPIPIHGVLGLAPIADLADYDRYTRCGPRAVTAFLGEDPSAGGERFAVSDPASLVPVPAPHLLLMGELDPIVPPPHGEAYGARVRARGQEVRIVTIPGAGHFELVAPWTPAWGAVEPTIREFLDAVIHRRP